MVELSVKNICRKVIILLLLSTCILNLAACSSANNDDAFLSNLQKGLEARWKLNDQDEGKTYSSASAYREDLLKYINAEYDRIGAFQDYQFTDSTLESYAEEYFNALNMQLEGYKYYSVDDTKYYELFSRAYKLRAEIIYHLYESYNFAVNDKYAGTFDEMVVIGQNYSQLRSAMNTLEEHTQELKLERTGSSEYVYSLKNTSELNFEYAELIIVGYDRSGVSTASGHGYLSSWNSGTVVNNTLWIEGEFEKATAQIVVNYNYESYTFEPVEIEVVDNLEISIIKPSIPQYVSYALGSRTYTTCQINSISYEITNWNDKKASVTIYLSGKKTYDYNGDSYSRSCRIGWKLYDSTGAVVDSGTCFTGDCQVGENFKNAEIKVYGITPGRYRLQLLDIG